MGIIFGVIVVMSAACWFIMKNMEKGNRRFVAIAVVEHIYMIDYGLIHFWSQ